jgi:hypothetical protein
VIILGEVIVAQYADRSQHTLSFVVLTFPIDVSAYDSLSLFNCRYLHEEFLYICNDWIVITGSRTSNGNGCGGSDGSGCGGQ